MVIIMLTICMQKSLFLEYLWEDIICKYWPLAQGKAYLFPDTITMKPCLSVMHAKAHSWHCQVILLCYKYTRLYMHVFVRM